MPVTILVVKGFKQWLWLLTSMHGCERKLQIAGLVGEGDGEELVSPVRDRILTKVKLSTHIRPDFRFMNKD